MTEPVELYNQGSKARATRYATEQARQFRPITRPPWSPGEDGKEIGHDSARFLVYQDDRELENPSADLKLAREIAELTGGELGHPREAERPPEGHRPLGLHRVRQPTRSTRSGTTGPSC